MTLLPLLALCPILLAVAFTDLSRLRIPNALVLAALALFAATCLTLPQDEILARLAAAGLAFLLLLPLFALRLMGGGDIKMLPAMVLFVPALHWQLFAGLFSAALVAGVVAIGLARLATDRATPTGWLAIDTPRAFPMGLSIAVAGIALTLWLALQA